MVTHLTTSQPVCCLNRAERTGSLVFNILWSNVEDTLWLCDYEALKERFTIVEGIVFVNSYGSYVHLLQYWLPLTGFF
jgi:hypothetical protein